MPIRVTRKAWRSMAKKSFPRGGHHDRNKCGVCERPGVKTWSRAKRRAHGL
jgi:hypothetical protein